MKRYLALAMLFPLISFGCENDAAKAAPTTICDIKKTPEIYENKIIIISAVYRSDRLHYSRLTDSVCGVENNSIKVGRNNSESSKIFWNNLEKECELKGESGSCIAKHEVIVIGRVRISDEGDFFDINDMQRRDDK